MTNDTDAGGLFITLEGLDGSGKTTVMDQLGNEYTGIFSSEPSRFWTGDQTRLAIEDADTHPLTDFHLFMADRAHHVNGLIRPALAAGDLVVVDRYTDSTRAYQREALTDAVAAPENFIEQALTPEVFIEPDLTIYLDVDVETAAQRSSDGDKYEDPTFHEEVRDNYKELAARHDRIIQLDATQPEVVVRGVCSEIVGEAVAQSFE